MPIPAVAVTKVLYALYHTGARRATKYLSPVLRVTASRQFRPSKRNTRETFVLTIGAPNYEDRKFIARCKKAGESLAGKDVQLRYFPVKRSA